MENQNPVEAYYDAQDEWSRLDRYFVEFAITKRYLDEFLPDRPLNILEIGGGPGRYSIYLAGKGHRVTLLDLSSRSVRAAREHAAEAGVALADAIHGNALNLPRFEAPFDAVLLMGPLYHLTKAEDRARAAREALDALAPGGLLFAAFISCYAPTLDYLTRQIPVAGEVESLLGYLEDGAHREGDGFTIAYFIDPHRARDFMDSFGLERLAFAGVENILSGREQELKQMPGAEREAWLEVGWRLSRDMNVIGSSHHLLYVGRKPG